VSRFVFIPALLLVGATALACGGGSDGEPSGSGSSSSGAASNSGPKIVAALSEFKIDSASTSAATGSLSFEAQNKGTTPHELKVVKTDLAPDKLPVKDGKVDESAVQVVAKTSEFGGGKSETVTANLTAGKYVLICNVVAHYPAGMHLAFAVE
jgi:uncharacterized cupredoxin-like copper-binding protein